MQINKLLNEIEAYGAQLVAVTKTQPVNALIPLFDAGIRIFGENRVQELLIKKPQLPSDINWHMIGHLQSNKIKQVTPQVTMIQSISSIKLYDQLQQFCGHQGLNVDILFEMQIASEDTKTGWDIDNFLSWIVTFDSVPHVRIRGLMGMASFTNDQDQIKKEFSRLRQLFEQLKKEKFPENYFDTVSMGMSSDYKIALDCGSTMVRIGSLLFQK